MADSSRVRIVEASDKVSGQRLDNFLLRELKGCPKSLIYRVIRKGQVRINGKRSKPDTRLESGDKIRIPPLRLPAREQPVQPGARLTRLLNDSILHENEDFLVINKPAGLAVHGGSGVRLGMIEALRQLRPEWRELELVHRLDRDTSGCLVIAKSSIFLREINKQIKNKSVTKIYQALVYGFWPDSLQEVNAPLAKNHLESGERMVRVSPDGKPALTRFRVLEHLGRQATLVEAQLDTGRTHQIRVHCLHAGHPILGDPKYGGRNLPESLKDLKKLCLHAVKLEFRYPKDGQHHQFQAALDDDFEAILKLLRSK